MSAPSPLAPPDGLGPWLARRSDAELDELLRLRPDLAVPPPADSTVLATRAALRASVARAADELDALALAVLEALTVARAADAPVTEAELRELLGEPAPGQVSAALETLRARALVWDSDEQAPGLLVAPATRDVVARHRQLGRPSPSLHGADVPALLAELDHTSLSLLRTLARGASPYGRTRDAAPSAPADRPVQQLLRAGLLLPVDEHTVELPSQVSAALREGVPLIDAAFNEPRPTPAAVPVAEVDAAAAGAALELLRQVAELIAALGAAPAPLLRAGGLGVREVRKLAKQTDQDEAQVSLLVELLAAAGLIAADPSADPAWTPTTAVDTWASAEPATRWATLAQAWLGMPRLTGLIGRRDDRDKPLAALSEELHHAAAGRDRRRVLGVLAELPPGEGLQADQLDAVLHWRRPRWGGRLRGELIGWTLAEATVLGVLGRGALSGPGRALLAGDEVAAAMAEALPPPLDHVLVQADLTLIAPGPLETHLEQEIALVADVESAGAATVYRVRPGSVRRALDAGRSAAELHELFAQHSRTPVPQALSYLIDDVARRHGRLRAGTAAAFVRCDDAALLSEVLASPVAGDLGLRGLAPTVAVSAAPLGEVLDGLRGAGFSPAAEDPTGAVLDLRPRGARIEVRRPRRRAPAPAAPNAEQREAMIRALRAGDHAASVNPTDRLVSDGTRASGMATMAVLQQAARSRRAVWVGYVDAQGVASQRVVEPVSVGAGVLEAFDPGAGEIRRFTLHRITSVALTNG